MKKPRFTTGWHSGRLVEFWSGYDCREVCEHGSATGGGYNGHGWTSDTLYVAIRSADDALEAAGMTIGTGLLRGRKVRDVDWSGRIVSMHTAYPTDAEQIRGEPEEGCSILLVGKCYAWNISGLVCEDIFKVIDANLAARLPRDDEGLCRGFLEGMPEFWSRFRQWHEEQVTAARAAREGLPHRCAACDGTGLIRGAK